VSKMSVGSHAAGDVTLSVISEAKIGFVKNDLWTFYSHFRYWGTAFGLLASCWGGVAATDLQIHRCTDATESDSTLYRPCLALIQYIEDASRGAAVAKARPFENQSCPFCQQDSLEKWYETPK
jgi:hypothetical protein